MIACTAWLGCSSSESEPASGGAASGAGASQAGAAGAPQSAAGAGPGAAAGMSASGGSLANAAAGSVSGGAPASGGSAGNPSAGAALGGGGGGGSSANAGAGAGGGVAGAPPGSCNLSTPVSFQKDIQGFLAKSCGKTVDGGCHVTDSSKTSLGYDHAYDWITAFAHTGSCGKTAPYAKRFEVVLALINGPKPASCPNARQMPPPGMGEPLTACQLAALQAWLAEPLVSQMHVPVSDDTKALYPAGPYLMPPFN